MSSDCFADEIAIDFPTVEPAVERMRDAFLGERPDDDVLRTEVPLSRREAWDGLVVPLDVPIRAPVPALRRPRRNLDRAVRRLPRHRRRRWCIMRCA